MAHSLDSLAAVHKAPDIDAERYKGDYGVEFTDPTAEQLDAFSADCSKLIDATEALEELYAQLGVNITKRAVLYQPSQFLTEPLTPEQVSRINDNETAGIAAYCVGLQEELETVPIQETREPMTHLPSLFSSLGIPITFSEVPFHAACAEWAGKQREFWVRQSVANRLVIASRLLEPTGAQLHIEDAFRPVGVQEGLFKRRVAWTKRDHPDWSEDQITAEAMSKTAVKPRLASHKAGAAIDALLRDKNTGELLDFGHNYPDGGALVFPRTPFVTFEQWRNRQLFQLASGLSDLTLYVGEDWHVSYGDNLASLDETGHVRTDYTAKYGPIKEFNHETGEVIDVYAEEEMNSVFPQQ